MFASSTAGDLAEAALEVVRLNRLHSPSEVEQARQVLFHNPRPDDDGGRLGFGKGPVPDAARLTVCHVLLLFIRVSSLSQHLGGQPESFRDRALQLFTSRFLPPVRRALDGIGASAWPELREALGACAVAFQKLPVTEGGEQEWLRSTERALVEFATTRFLLVGGKVSQEVAEHWLDPFNSAAAIRESQAMEVHAERDKDAAMRRAEEAKRLQAQDEGERLAKEAALGDSEARVYAPLHAPPAQSWSVARLGRVAGDGGGAEGSCSDDA
jgi:hypothetical protein